MSLKTSFVAFLRKFGSVIGSAVGLAIANGLKDDVIELALKWVKVAAGQFTSDEKKEKREFVVKILMSRGIPESIARMAVEFAYQIFKDEISKIPTSIS